MAHGTESAESRSLSEDESDSGSLSEGSSSVSEEESEELREDASSEESERQGLTFVGALVKFDDSVERENVLAISEVNRRWPGGRVRGTGPFVLEFVVAEGPGCCRCCEEIWACRVFLR